MVVEILDTVQAETLTVNDLIRYDGEEFRITSKEDEGDLIALGVDGLSSVDSDDVIYLDPFEWVDLIRYN